LAIFDQHIAIAHNGVERCAQLVAHMGKKSAFAGLAASALYLSAARLRFILAIWSCRLSAKLDQQAEE
jgi:hypothetical protein